MHKTMGYGHSNPRSLGEWGIFLEKNIPKRPRDGPFGTRVGPGKNTLFSKEVPHSTQREN
jgi:hypothetical protein